MAELATSEGLNVLVGFGQALVQQSSTMKSEAHYFAASPKR